MTLDELITALAVADPTLVLPHGFTNPHSYRGYYDELAFEPATNVTVADMFTNARTALGTTYTGWKGGDFTMRGYTDCWLAQEGSAGGETLGPLLLQFMLDAGIRDAARQTTGQDDTEPRETCRPVEADGTTILVRSTGDWTAEDQHHMAEVVAAAKRKYEAEHAAVGQPAEAHDTDEAPLTAAERQFLTFALDLADNRMANRSDEFTSEDYQALAALRRMAEEARS